MTTLFETITTAELLNDLTASRMDLFTWYKLTCGRTPTAEQQKRMDANRRMIEIIKPELERRGIDVPACTFPNVP